MTLTEEPDTRRGSSRVVTGTPTSQVPPRATLPGPRRRPALLAVGVSLTSLGVLGGVFLVNQAGTREAVLSVRQPVAYGSVITAGDLATVQVSHDPGLAAMPASQLSLAVGKIATTQLSPGTLLTTSELADTAPPAAGQVLVALAVPPSRLPAGSLQPGDRILVVDTPAPGADAPTLPPSTVAATVVRLGLPDVNGTTVVDVTVAAKDGPSLAAQSATGRIALVLQPRGQ